MKTTEMEFEILLEHAQRIVRAIYEEKGSWYTRTLVARWLEDFDEEYVSDSKR